jgi:hypothetical protein
VDTRRTNELDDVTRLPYDQPAPLIFEGIRMGIISMIIVGFIVGLIARALMPGDQMY